MDIQDLLHCLDYSESPYFLTGSRLNTYPAYSHTFHLAKQKCGLQGVYTLSAGDTNQALSQSAIPVVYVCKADTEEEAVNIHKLVWNQNTAPFLLVESPKYFRLYPGFRYDVRAKAKKNQEILRISKDANEVLAKLADFKADAINSGIIWEKWGKDASPETRVDTKLLRDLKALSAWFRGQGLKRHSAHALIGKYVYLHYLKDREILSDRKFLDWKLDRDSVFGRNATIEGFHAVTERLDSWLNGTIFPIAKDGPDAPSTHHIQKVAATFSGDEPQTGQMHLGFNAYNFQHISIETLSIVYQQFLHAEGRGRGQGAYYTPIHLVNFILDGLDKKLPLQKGMTVFDPACGSGAFLVQCFRRLIEREIARESERKISPFYLRKLLTDHIYGIDIDEDACGVTELSLTMTLLDYVDPPDLKNPQYKDFVLPMLRNQNIFCCEGGFFDPEPNWHAAKPQKGYDWIVGNPPWKAINSNKLEQGDAEALTWMKKNSSRFPVSSKQIAEAFAWEVSRHVSEHGVIGLLMPAGSLFNTNSGKFRQKFFSGMNVWCMVNFANLRRILFKGPVKPAAAFFYSCSGENVNTTSHILTYAPFAVNQLPQYAIKGEKRRKLWTVTVNADELREISVTEAASGNSQPWKIAMWGSHRDRFLLNSLANRFSSLLEFKDRHRLEIYEGFQLCAANYKHPKVYMRELVGKNEVDMDALLGVREIYYFPPKALKRIGPERAYLRKRGGLSPLKVCNPPHIFVDATRRFAIFSDVFFVIPPRQIGIAGNTMQRNLLKALAIYFRSNFVLYHQFLSSASWGIERDRLEKADLEKIPIPLDELSPDEIAQWAGLYDDLAEISKRYFAKSHGALFDEPQNSQDIQHLKRQLNEAVYSLMGIAETERWLIEDLLDVRKGLIDGRLPKSAVESVNHDAMYNYAEALKMELDGFLDAEIKDQHRVTVFAGDQLAVIKVEHPQNPPAGPVKVITVKNQETEAEFNRLKSSLLHEQGQWIYFHRNLKFYNGRTTYFVKPRQRLSWLKSQALIDADEFIAEKLR